MTPQEVQLQQYIKNWEEYIAYLTTRPHSKLLRRLDLIREQMQMAVDQKKFDSLDLLSEMEQQTIAARLIKTENNTPDVPTEGELIDEENRLREQEYDRQQKLNKERKEMLEKFSPVDFASEETGNEAPVEEDNKEDDKGEEQLSLF